MSSTIEPLYSGSATSITITLASLANGSYRQATGVDNSTTKYADILITGKMKTGASGVSATGSASFFVVGYDGTQYSNNATGTDGSFTPDNQANLVQIYQLSMVANATEYYLPPIYLAAAAGFPMIPQKWAIIVLNNTGAAFDSTGTNFVIEYQGFNPQIV